MKDTLSVKVLKDEPLHKIIPENIFPDVLWIVFWLFLIFYFRKNIAIIVKSITSRIANGATLKLGSFELGEIKVTASTTTATTGGHFTVKDDIDKLRCNDRLNFHADVRHTMLVHKLFKSTSPNQLYDILIYLIPHKQYNLTGIDSVEYYFGQHWGDKIYVTKSRYNGFAIAISAYGSTLCTAKINFTDGTHTMQYRYLDFEMGNAAFV